MTDAEIIKALECCSKDRPLTKKECMHECPYFNVLDCKKHCMRNVVDLINRLKADNDRLIGDCTTYKVRWTKAVSSLENAKSKAYKEFVTKAEKKAQNAQTWTGIEPVVTVSDLNNILKEMGLIHDT